MVRVLVGIAVGLGYGVLVGAGLFLIDFITGDSDNSSGLMINAKAIFVAILLLAMIATGTLGAVVGLLVTVFRAGKIKAAIIGFGTGLLILSGVLVRVWPQLDFSANSGLGFTLLFLLILIIGLPAGLAATGVTASVVAARVSKS